RARDRGAGRHAARARDPRGRRRAVARDARLRGGEPARAVERDPLRRRPADRDRGRVAARGRFGGSGKLTAVRATTTTEETQSGTLVLLCLASWAIPGAGHLWLGRRAKGVIFLVALPLMFAIGLAIRGRLFPFDVSEPLVALAAVADVGIGLPYVIASALGYGGG